MNKKLLHDILDQMNENINEVDCFISNDVERLGWKNLFVEINDNDFFTFQIRFSRNQDEYKLDVLTVQSFLATFKFFYILNKIKKIERNKQLKIDQDLAEKYTSAFNDLKSNKL